MSKYRSLYEHLSAASAERLNMRFAEIEQVLGFRLPESARRYQAWWANDASAGRHADAWLSAGWKTQDLDLGGARVTFVRAAASDVAKPARRTAAPVARTPRAADAPSYADLPDAPEGRVEFAAEMQWKQLGAITLDDGGALAFPAAPVAPGLYRFRLLGTAGARRYIGETTELRRRFQNYRTPGPSQATNIRINDILRAHLAAGGTVAVDIIFGMVSIMIGGNATALDLSDKAARRLLEHAALVADGATEIESLNR